MMYVSFFATYGAKKFLDLMIDDQEFKWLNCAAILTAQGVTIKTTTAPNPKRSDFSHFDLEDLMDYDYKPAERDFEFTPRQVDAWQQFCLRQTDTGTRPDNPVSGPRVKTERTPKQPKEPREPKTQRDPNKVTVGTVAEQMGIEATKARAALRKSGTPKPASGWEWAQAEVPGIITIIKANLK